ncbi:GC-type dockerin domain-anchored protein [Synechococcus sp. Cruz CV-v-12]|uniref:GC-type dockerin domain-anchored protein n=1 Tax=Synechococcus sp. Cruz CV-v-12 TaxID=2823728 RepID=UPI0020CFD1AB|nr:GC-type dockerin domain-anchored protein [Synechococcus sp. Cruz CV-v-12]MCP9874830.1 hypothetical protein [Synechococcus sp. Cruz CV-v-12]
MKSKIRLSACAVAILAGSTIAAPQELQTFPGPYNIYADGDPANPSIDVTFTGTGYAPIGWRILFDMDAVAAGTWVQDLDIIVTPPGGVPATYNVGGQTYTTTLDRGGDIALPPGIAGPGTWNFSFADNFEDGPAGGVESILRNLRVSLISADAPTGVIIVTDPVDGGAWSSATSSITAANGIAWFSVNVPASVAQAFGNAFDLDTFGTNLAPVNDCGMSVYNSGGVLVTSDDDFGPGLLSQCSFGTGTRAAVGDGAFFDGIDGPIDAGTYFVGVRGGNGAWGLGFTPIGNTANTGPVTLRARSYSTFTSGAPDTIYTNVINAGTIGSPTAAENVQSQTVNVTDGNRLQWFKFATPADTAGATLYYLDIDTEGTANGVTEAVGGLMDTEIGVYDNTGTVIGFDDDGGNGFRSALSFGDPNNVRPAITPIAPALVGLARNGRNGELAAGNYWVVMGTYDVTFGNTGWGATGAANRAATVGQRTLNFRSNLPAGPTNPCPNPSNVSGPGQNTVTIDGELTADDIIVFLNRFFAGNLLSNVSGPGQDTVNLDAELTADDIIVFLNRFFAGC